MRRKHPSEPDQFALFRALPGDFTPRDAQDLMAYPFFSLAKTKRVVPIDFRASVVSIRVEGVPKHRMATVWDADELICVVSQIVEVRNAGLKTSRLIAAIPYQTLKFVGRDTNAREYDRLTAGLGPSIYLLRDFAGADLSRELGLFVLSGTATFVLSETGCSCDQGPKSYPSPCSSAISSHRISSDQKSFGFLVTVRSIRPTGYNHQPSARLASPRTIPHR